MNSPRLSLLHLSPMPAGPLRPGARPRIHGLLAPLEARHDLNAPVLADAELVEEAA